MRRVSTPMALPFDTLYEMEEHNEDLRSCGVFRMLPKDGKEYVEKNTHVLHYLHVIPLEKIGVPKFYEKLSRELRKLRYPNIIYPVSDEISVHVFPDKEDVRNYYIPIEPSMFQDLSDLIMEVEKKLIDVIDEVVRIEDQEEKKALLEKYIDKVCVVSNSNGRRRRLFNGNGGRLFNGNGGRLFNGNGGHIFNGFLKFNNNGGILVTQEQLKAIKYLMVRDKVGLGVLEPLIQDPYIEDISCSGIGSIFVEHKIFQALKTTIRFDEPKDLDDFIIKLSEKIGKPVSYRNPIVDATLPDGSRINIVFGEDVSKRGSNFTIRKFSETPLSVLELIEFGTFNYMMAAYFWLLMKEGMNFFVSGETASGKTTTLNALTTFIPPQFKIVTIEDTPEIQVPHPNWTREVVRGSNEEGRASVTMFDLLKAALRQRPNEIIVGEIRGEEGNIAFQAMQTGHSVCATFHAASVEKLIQRLTGNPINVPKTYIDNLNFVIIQSQVRTRDGRLVRRVLSVNEIVGYDPATESFAFIEVFSWDPARDRFVFSGNMNSYLLENKIAVKRGMTGKKKREIYRELEKRAKILKKLHESGITNFYDLFAAISKIEKEGVV
ncbi:MAG: Type IV secretory pathway ATPase VirB11/Archaellum biosynthesis ATPase ArlI/FlaI [Candidatus Alkanophagales archaeon MCA70_species_2]|nr:Type IV secretory pathway ATPase VirB11/Archaellum biosynthesis ATPase ArlI/FlaI [Candidatus Alkanophaga liquidiphilum]